MSFQSVLALQKQVEGPYSNDANDAGGMTICGIDRKSNPKWEGFAIADGVIEASKDLLDDEEIGAALDKNVELQKAISAFYQKSYDSLGIDRLPESLQAPVFCGIQNQGIEDVWLFQKSLCELGQAVPIDGKLGPATFHAAAQVNPVALKALLFQHRVERYVATVHDHANDRDYLLGWLDRLELGA